MNIYISLFFGIDSYNQNIIDTVNKQPNIFKYDTENKYAIVINLITLSNFFVILYINRFNIKFGKEFIGKLYNYYSFYTYYYFFTFF